MLEYQFRCYLGDNSILQKATDAKTNTDNAQIRERIQLSYHSALAEGKGSYTRDTLMDELKNEFGTDYDVDDSDDDNWILYAQGQSVTIPARKEDTTKIIIKAGDTNLKNITNLSTLYGESVDYTSVEGITWQLFYDDDTNIYLIASDYVPVSTLGEELYKESGDANSKYRAWFSTGWDSTSSTYKGTIMETAPWSAGTESTTITSNSLTGIYLKWVNSSVVSTKNNPNMRAVAYMMDTSRWSNFAGEAKGAYAIGGPTIEMFALSYNAKHETKLGTYGTSKDDITSTNANQYGYYVKKSDSSWSTGISGLDTSGSETGGNMWVRTKYDKADAMWLTSPSSDYLAQMCVVSGNGSLSVNGISYNWYGFRPLISIPKSSLK